MPAVADEEAGHEQKRSRQVEADRDRPCGARRRAEEQAERARRTSVIADAAAGRAASRRSAATPRRAAAASSSPTARPPPLRRVRPSPHLVLGQRPALERVVARGDVVAMSGRRLQVRLVDVAVAVLEARAARVEAARLRRVDRARHVALEHDRLSQAAERRGSGSARPRGARPCTDASDGRTAPVPGRARRPCRGTSRATRSEMCRTTLRSCAMKT